MMIDIHASVIKDLRNLLTQLDNQYEAIKDNTMGWFMHDTIESNEKNSDPEDLNEIDIQTLALAHEIKIKLKL